VPLHQISIAEILLLPQCEFFMKIEILKQAVLDSRDGITISDNLVHDNPLIFVNPAFERMTGYSSEKIMNLNCRYLQNNDRDQGELKIVKRAIIEGQYCLVIVRNYRKDGTMFWNELSISPIYDANGVVTNFIGIQKDVSARVIIQQQLRDENLSLAEIRINLEQLAIKDGLTGIYNRRFFDIQLEIQWGIARRNSEPLTIIMIDVDHFKQFNDIHGHNAGDIALRRVAESLNKSFLRSSDFVARYGGEEFVVLSVGMTQDQAALFAATLCERVRSLEIPHPVSSTGYLTVSIGVSTHACDTCDHSSALLGLADKALYAAKQRGRNQFFSF
jgi:diguanylate cyclase (GGDEF)-like protein/PAS domain S-box-containing protein